MAEHPRCGLRPIAIPKQWIEPTAEHQQPAGAEPRRRQAPPPTPAPCKIDGHACCDQHQAIAAAQHQQQQAKPEPGAMAALGPERQSEGGHHPGFGVEIEEGGVEHHRLQPPQRADQPAASARQPRLLRQPPDRQRGAAQSQGLAGQEPMHAWKDPVGPACQVEHPGPVVGQHMHLLHRGDWCGTGADQPGPLIEQSQVIGIALQKAMA